MQWLQSFLTFFKFRNNWWRISSPWYATDLIDRGLILSTSRCLDGFDFTTHPRRVGPGLYRTISSRCGFLKIRCGWLVHSADPKSDPKSKRFWHRIAPKPSCWQWLAQTNLVRIFWLWSSADIVLASQISGLRNFSSDQLAQNTSTRYKTEDQQQYKVMSLSN